MRAGSKKIVRAFLAWLACSFGAIAVAAGSPQEVVARMNVEILKRNSHRDGRPLPVASHWASGFGGDNFSSDCQVAQLEKGHHVMPTLPLPTPGNEAYPPKGRPLVKKLAAWSAPFSLRGGQWEEVLYSKNHPVHDPGAWLRLQGDQSPAVISPEGKPDTSLSPLGAVTPWMEAGLYTASSRGMRQLTEWYPQPPLVIFLSNNESDHIKFKHDITTREKRFVDAFGMNVSPWRQREIIGDGYIDRFGALLVGMSRGIPSDSWRAHSLFVGYEAFGPPHFGRWKEWPVYSLTTEERISPWHLVWQGGSPSYYTHNWDASTDHTVWSPQVEAMNWVFMQEEVLAEAPNFWFELAVWDGNFSSNPVYANSASKIESYKAAGQHWTPERYKGFVRYGMWLTMPRCVREFRLSAAYRREFEADYEALLDAVDEVWDDPVLTEFWRRGELVPNPRWPHPYQVDIPRKWQNVDRWFMLDSSLDPPRPWKLDTNLPVFSLARVLGKPGEREWLVFAHSPLGPHQDVELTIPDYKTITCDTDPAGSFYLVRDKDGSVTRIGR